MRRLKTKSVTRGARPRAALEPAVAGATPAIHEEDRLTATVSGPSRCPRCGIDYEDDGASLCPDCVVRVREAVRHVDALQQICADRPDLVHYLDGLLREVRDRPASAPPQLSPTSIEGLALSPNHVRWRALIGKSQPHLDRCGKWHSSEKTLPRAPDGTTNEPQPNWADEDLHIKMTAVEDGDLTIEATWTYGPRAGGHGYRCNLAVSGWDHVMHLHWLRRSIYTLFFVEPETIVIRNEAAVDDATEPPLGDTESIGGLG